MLTDIEKLLGINYKEFLTINNVSNELKKWPHGEPNDIFSVIYLENEYQFHEGKLASIKISNFKLNKKLGNIGIKRNLEKNIQEFNKLDIPWEVHKNSSGQSCVGIKLNKFIIYHHVFLKNGFKLETIKVFSGDFLLTGLNP